MRLVAESLFAGAVSLATVAVLVGLSVSARVDADPSSPGTPAGYEPRGVQSFVNWETPQVRPIALTPDRSRLLVVNTAAATLEVFSLASGSPRHLATIPVGLDPVTVRARTNTEAWVVNHVSDSVSIVDLVSGSVTRTLDTADEPCDVVFAGTPTRAFVSCSQVNQVQVFDLANLAAPVSTIDIFGEDPRALEVSPDGQTVYAAIFESGNRTTILGGGASTVGGMRLAFPPNVVNNPVGPYGGVNPPPNSGTATVPTPRAGNPPAPAVGLIVRKNAAGQWMDDNARDWTDLVSGSQAAQSGRRPGWDLADHDVAAISTSSLSVSYATGLMNLCMAMGVNPATGAITVVGTEATNEKRYEPNIAGRFTRVQFAAVNPVNLAETVITDLNPHLTYATATIAQPERNRSIGDPRAIAWNSSGTKGYVAGMGSNNVIVVNAAGTRAGVAQTIEVGEGPTGIALDEARGSMYVLNRFEGSISVVSLSSEAESARVSFFDPTPAAIRTGRKHLYDTHKTSGLGQIACASCHVDGRMDRLAWDLGDPSAAQDPLGSNNLGFGFPGLASGQTQPAFQPFHPMKGPMTTQTFQDIIGHEPHHWRGDRPGIEAFNAAFIGLQGDDALLTSTEMQEFENFLATITFPPNPYRNFDNTLPVSLPLPGHYTIGRFSPAGFPLPNGNAVNGLSIYRNFTSRRLDSNAFACVTCHTLPTGSGTDTRLVGSTFQNILAGPNGERHRALVSVDGSTNVSIKIPQLRNMHEKSGFNTTQLLNTAGFGYLHDGSIDSIERFVGEPVFTVNSDQEIANLTALMLAFSGSDLPAGSINGAAGEPPGGLSKDTHAAVGTQTTLRNAAAPDPGQTSLIASMISLADQSRVGVIVKGKRAGALRGWAYTAGGIFQSDRAGETIAASALQALAAAGSELTYTVVPRGSQTRLGIDRDLDGTLDGDEPRPCVADVDDGSGTGTPDGGVGIEDLLYYLSIFDLGTSDADVDDGSSTGTPDGGVGIEDLLYYLARFDLGC